MNAQTPTLEEAKNEVTVAVYEATRIFERLEAAGLISGNGHHIRQKLATDAAAMLESRWTTQPPAQPKPAGWSLESASLDVEGGLD